MLVCQHGLAALTNPFHRPFDQTRGQKRQLILRKIISLHAETAADIARNHAEIGLRYAHHRARDIAAQTEAILDKFLHILEENGAALSNVVRVTSFVTDLREAAAAGEVRLKRFAGAFPASTQVQIAALGTPDLKIEIDAIAVLPD